MDVDNYLTGTVMVINRSRVERDLVVDAFNDISFFEATGYFSFNEALHDLGGNEKSIIIIPIESDSFFTIVAEIISNYKNTIVVASGVELKTEMIVGCAEAGVKGYIELEATISDWVSSVISAMNGEVANSKIAGILLQYINHGSPKINSNISSWRVSEDVEQSSKRVGLTPRERQIVGLIDKGLSNKAIAKELHVESNTVKNHVHSILTKYGVRHRGEAAAKFRKNLDNS